ncbi:MAG TPA: arginine--tRNA ligase [Planctomycetota bacterium]|nr:arginine--tRNA ligase [Planctomycetota bacterium]
MTDLHSHLRYRLLSALADLGVAVAAAEPLVRLDPPKNRDHGDVALGAFQLARLAGKAPPALAAELAAKITPDTMIESVTAAGPFVNFRFHRAALAREVLGAIQAGDAPYGATRGTGQTVCVDFSSPNIAKPFHIGHMRSTVLGNALCRIHRHLGATVHGINHLGDWGMPFAKMMTAYMRWGDEQQLHRSPMRYMFDLYKRYAVEQKLHPELDEEAAAHFRALESGADNQERRMWQLLRDESLKAFEGPYRRLGITFDHVTGESFFEDKMEAAMQRVRAAGVLENSDGAEVVWLKELGIKEPCLLRKSDGATLYHTRDLAAVFYREATFHPDRILYVVGAEQKLHFDQLKGVLTKMKEPIAKAVEHVPFGLVLSKSEDGKWEKFASRAGNAVFLDEILDEAVAKVREIIREKNPDLPDAEQVAEQVGVSAIVFNDLKNSRIKDVKFDWDAMLNFDGETGPYVQFACARLASILRKVEVPVPATDQVDFSLLADAERVLLVMMDFGSAVQRAAEQSEPSIVTGHTIALAGEIHSYLRDHYVVGAEPAVRDARLVLVDAARRLLTTGLGLLGIAAPERM